MPRSRSIGPMGGSNGASAPLTSLPSSRSNAASAPISVPEIPMRCACMRGSRTRLLVLCEHEIIADPVDPHRALGRIAASEDLFGQRVLKLLENRTPQGSRSERRLVAQVDELVLGGVREANLELAVGHELLEALQLDVHDASEVLLRERPEKHDVVDAIQELRA